MHSVLLWMDSLSLNPTYTDCKNNIVKKAVDWLLELQGIKVACMYSHAVDSIIFTEILFC